MKAKTFNDVLIKPKYSEVKSREFVDVSTQLGPFKFNFPIITANMRTITDTTMAIEIGDFGGLGILHRFYKTIEDNVAAYKGTLKDPLVDIELSEFKTGVSIGVKDEEKKRFEALYEAGARIFCVDVAHGHHKHVHDMLKWVNDQVFLWDRSERSKMLIIAGNIATPEGYSDLIQWGADAIKVGLGPGRVCTTRKNTGVGVPQLYALEEVWNQSLREKDPKPIIADGGCSYSGDIAKALKYSDAVMIGSMISGTDETPGEIYKDKNDRRYKIYGGSASRETKGHKFFVEGVTIEVEPKGPAKEIFYEIKDGIRSAFSYVGANNLAEFHNKCEFIDITSGGRIESKLE